MARGGQRRGTPGKSYAQRTDLHQPIQAAPGGEYGSVTALKNAQHIVPLPNANAAPSPSPLPTQSATGGGGVAPGDINFEAPTARPNEPVTAGLPVGPGPGPESLGLGVGPNDSAALLRSIYQNVSQAQNNDVLRVLEALDQRSQ